MADEPDNVINLSRERPAHREPIESFSLTIERYALNEEPYFTVHGLGDTAAEIDVRKLTKDVLHACLAFASEKRDAGGQATAVAFASIWTDGSVSTQCDVELFEAPERRAWLRRAIDMIRVSFTDLLGSVDYGRDVPETTPVPTNDDPS